MAAEVIDGKAVSAAVRERVASVVTEEVAAGHRAPALATVLVGEDPASHVYVANKRKACEAAGIRSVHHQLSAEISQGELEALVADLDRDSGIDGILVQMPLPDALGSDAVLGLISPSKDVDGLTPANAGLLAQGKIGVAEALELEGGGAPKGLIACTPSGVMELLRVTGVELEGAEAVIVGRSTLVGRPLASLMLAADATVTVCHSRTADLPQTCRRADVLVAAVGRAEMVGGAWIKPGASVIDVGINRTDDGIVGDVAFAEAVEVAGSITPVPGGVGPMTIAMLLANTVRAARAGRVRRADL